MPGQSERVAEHTMAGKVVVKTNMSDECVSVLARVCLCLPVSASGSVSVLLSSVSVYVHILVCVGVVPCDCVYLCAPCHIAQTS
jgi:hypothetical protein